MAPPHPDTVYHLVNAVTSGETAWRTASNTGANDIEAVVNAIWTLALYASPAEPPCEPKRLLAVHDSGTASLDRLRTTLRRLRAIVTAIERWLPDLLQVHPLLHSQTLAFANALKLDLAEKTEVVEAVGQSILNGRPVSNAIAVTLVARWSETISLVGAPDAATIQALVEPLELMDRFNDTRSHNPSNCSASILSPSASSAASPNKSLSPALAMLTKSTSKR